MNWYKVTTAGFVVKYGATKEQVRYFHTTCAWTQDSLLAALAPRAEEEGVADLRIYTFTKTREPSASWGVDVVDLDAYLGM